MLVCIARARSRHYLPLFLPFPFNQGRSQLSAGLSRPSRSRLVVQEISSRSRARQLSCSPASIPSMTMKARTLASIHLCLCKGRPIHAPYTLSLLFRYARCCSKCNSMPGTFWSFFPNCRLPVTKVSPPPPPIPVAPRLLGCGLFTVRSSSAFDAARPCAQHSAQHSIEQHTACHRSTWVHSSFQPFCWPPHCPARLI